MFRRLPSLDTLERRLMSPSSLSCAKLLPSIRVRSSSIAGLLLVLTFFYLLGGPTGEVSARRFSKALPRRTAVLYGNSSLPALPSVGATVVVNSTTDVSDG